MRRFYNNPTEIQPQYDSDHDKTKHNIIIKYPIGWLFLKFAWIISFFSKDVNEEASRIESAAFFQGLLIGCLPTCELIIWIILKSFS